MRVAVVHDWLVINGGAEKVTREILHCYPDADVFSLVDFLSEKDRAFILLGKGTKNSFIQELPWAKKHYRSYLPLFPAAIESLNLSGYDLIISSSYAVAKGVKKTDQQLHICYCHSPMRYAHDLYEHYLYETGLSPIKRLAAKLVLPVIRKWDIRVSSRVDFFIANSAFIKARIQRVYNRDSVVIHPPVDLSAFKFQKVKQDYYLCYGRQVPYKKTDEIIKAFEHLPHLQLKVAGGGPMVDSLKAKAPRNVEVLGELPFNELVTLVSGAKGLIVTAEEDFGITPLEAQATGTPVIALRKGGYLETVVEGETGLFFEKAKSQTICKAIESFESQSFSAEDCRKNAERFGIEIFLTEFRTFVEDKKEVALRS